MPASLDDILTTQKNGVLAINTLGNALSSTYQFQRGTLLARKSMTTAVETLYTVQAGYQMTVSEIDICNTAGSAGTFTLYFVPSGGTAGISNSLFAAQSVAANTTFQSKGAMVLNAGDTIQSLASDTTMTVMITGGISS